VPATLTTASNILKEVYGPSLQEQINKEAVAIKRIEPSKGDGIETSRTGGKYVRFGIRTRRNPGIGYRNENEALPTGGSQTYEDVKIGLGYGYGMLQLTGQVMRLAESDYQAFTNVVDDEMDGLKSDVVKDANRVVYSDGTGALAVTTAVATANQVTVANAQYLEVGQMIDIVSTGGTVRGSNRQITAIAGAVVTYSGADITTDVIGDLVVRTGNFGREPNGFTSIVKATGALYDVDPAVEPVWASVVDANAGTNRALSETLMIAVMDRVRTAGGGQPSAIFGSLGVRRSYFNLLTQQRRFTDTKSYDGGVRGLSFMYGDNDVPMISDPDAPLNKMWGISENKLKVFREKDWDWDDTDGSMWSRVSGFDAFEARLYKYWQLGVLQRNAHFLIADITES
jgi:hypothetical protein